MDTSKKYYNNKTEKIGNATAYILLGWVCAAVSLFVYSFAFGIAGVVMGILSTKKQNQAGIPVIIASIVFMSIGLIYGPVLTTFLRRMFNF